MLYNNDIKNLTEIKALFSVESKGSELLVEVCERFFTQSVTRQLASAKSKGFKAT